MAITGTYGHTSLYPPYIHSNGRHGTYWHIWQSWHIWQYRSVSPLHSFHSHYIPFHHTADKVTLAHTFIPTYMAMLLCITHAFIHLYSFNYIPVAHLHSFSYNHPIPTLFSGYLTPPLVGIIIQKFHTVNLRRRPQVVFSWNPLPLTLDTQVSIVENTLNNPLTKKNHPGHGLISFCGQYSLNVVSIRFMADTGIPQVREKLPLYFLSNFVVSWKLPLLVGWT